MAPLGRGGGSSASLCVAAAADPACLDCGSPPSTPSPVDAGRTRAWTEDQQRCQWCQELRSILSTGRVGTPPGGDSIDRSPRWLQNLTAFFTLRLEGHLHIAYPMLDGRRRILDTVLSSSPWPALAGGAGAGSSQGVVGAVGGAAGDNFKTPTKEVRASLAADSAAASPCGSLAPSAWRKDHPMVKHEMMESPSAAAARAPAIADARGDAASEAGAGDGDADGWVLDEGADDDAELAAEAAKHDLNELSITGRFRGQLTQSLKRMRRSINSYVCRMCEVHWYTTFQHGTVKALERRFSNHAKSIDASHDADIIGAFAALRDRVGFVLSMNRALEQWLASGHDTHLDAVRRMAKELTLVWSTFGRKVALDLAIVVVQALEAVSVDALGSHFQKVDAAPLAAMKDVNMGGQEPRKVGSSASLAPRPAIGKPKGKRGALLRPGDKPLDIAIKLIDKALEVKLFSIRDSDDGFIEGMQDLVGDGTEVQRWWKAAFSENTCSVKYGELIESVVAVCTCALEPAKTLPSVARQARQVINQCGAASSPWKLAASMQHAAGARRAMNCSQQVSTQGLQDQAADEQFGKLYDCLEARLSKAFDEGVCAWALEGPGHEAHSMESFMPFIELGQRSVVEFRQVMGSWSSSGMETQADNITNLVQGIVMIVQVGNWVLAQSSELYLPSLMDLLSPAPNAAANKVDDADCIDARTESVDERAGGEEDSQITHPRPWVDADGASPAAEVNFESLRAEAGQLRTVVEWYTSSLCLLAEGTAKALDALAAKMGQSLLAPLTEAGVCGGKMRLAVHHNKKLLLRFCQYFDDCSQLTAMKPFDSVDCSADWTPQQEQYMKVLASFSRNHHCLVQGKETQALMFEGDCATLLDEMLLPQMVSAFVSECGVSVFEQHTLPTLNSIIASIMSSTIHINPVEVETMQDCRLLDLYSMLVKSPIAEDLVGTIFEEKSAIKANEESRMTTTALFQHLTEFVCTLQLKTIRTSVLKQATASVEPDARDVPAPHLIMLLSVVSEIRLVASYVAALHVRFAVEVQNSDNNIADAISIRLVPGLIQSLSMHLGALSRHLDGAGVKAMEFQRWQSDLNMAATRQWVGGMEFLKLRYEQSMLKAWAKRLSTAAATTSAACPSLTAAMSDDTYDEEMAFSMSGKDKVEKVIKAHNGLHDLMTVMRTGAAQINLEPLMNSHPLMKSEVAIALHTLSTTRNASLVMEGVFLMAKGRKSPSGPKTVKEFWYDIPTNMRDQMPKGFVAAMEAFAGEAIEGVPQAGERAVKEEQGTEGGGNKRAHDDTVTETTAAGEDMYSPVAPSEASSTMAAEAAGFSKLKRRRK